MPENFWLAKLASILVSTIVFVLLYYFTIDVFFDGEHNFIATLVVYFIAILLGQYTSYQIMITKYNIPNSKEVSISLIILMFIVFVFLTYNPIESRLFLDESSNSYGILNVKQNK